jgi:transcriptional regulator
VVITRKDLIAKRREEVYKYHWKGLSSREIASQLRCSFFTVCKDIKWLEEQANQEIKEHRKHMALEYKEAVRTFRYLLTKALEQFEKADINGEDEKKERLYPIIESLNANLLSTRGVSDLVEKELTKHLQEKAERIIAAEGEREKEEKIILDKTSGKPNQEVF